MAHPVVAVSRPIGAPQSFRKSAARTFLSLWLGEDQVRNATKSGRRPEQSGLTDGPQADFNRPAVPVLVVYTLEETAQDKKAMVQSFVNAMYQAMKWVKATPIDDIYELVCDHRRVGAPLALAVEPYQRNGQG